MKDRVYRSPINFPKSGTKMDKCYFPLRIDTYSSCSHGCVYCYAQPLLKISKNWNPDCVRIADINEIIRKITYYLQGKSKTEIGKAFQGRLPVRLGGLTDCFQPLEKEKEITLELIKFLNSKDYPYLIFTKSDLVSKEPYLSTFRQDLAYFQITITASHESLARKIEPFAPSPAKRIKTMKKLIDQGFYTAARIAPIIPRVTDKDCLQLIDECKKIGVPHIIIEFLRGQGCIIKQVEKATGVRIKPYFQNVSKSGVFYRYPLREKIKFFKKVARRLRNSNTFVTYCSDGDEFPKELQCTTDCCGASGIPRLVPDTKFKNFNGLRN